MKLPLLADVKWNEGPSAEERPPVLHRAPHGPRHPFPLHWLQGSRTLASSTSFLSRQGRADCLVLRGGEGGRGAGGYQSRFVSEPPTSSSPLLPREPPPSPNSHCDLLPSPPLSPESQATRLRLCSRVLGSGRASPGPQKPSSQGRCQDPGRPPPRTQPQLVSYPWLHVNEEV